jgi:hypothetical protein
VSGRTWCKNIANYIPVFRYRPRTSSSRSTVTPLGPNRLTLPPGQHPPSLSSNRAQDPAERSYSHSRPPPKASSNPQRPGSSRFLEYVVIFLCEKCAYIHLSPRKTDSTRISPHPRNNSTLNSYPIVKLHPAARNRIRTSNLLKGPRALQRLLQDSSRHKERLPLVIKLTERDDPANRLCRTRTK